MVRLALPVLMMLTLVACGGRASEPPPTLTSFGQLPLTFVENRGQSDSQVRFQVNGPGHAFFLTREGIALSLKDVGLSLRFVDAAPVTPVGAHRAPGTTNYIQGGREYTGIPGYGEVVYRELWPGIDMALRGNGTELKYEFRVRPGADPADIQLAYRGASGLRVDGGALLIDTAAGALRDAPPIAFQDGALVQSRYAVDGLSYGFDVGAYDASRELIIDPGLAYSTFLGGSAHEMGASIAVDAAGNSYVTGFTQSPNFPTTSGAFDRTGAASNNLDVFVTKLNPAGTAAVYSTFIGGTNFDWGRGITVDSAGNAYVTGQTKSSNFPTTSGAFDRSFNVDSCPRCGIDQEDAFVLKLNAAGSALTYSTFLGGFDLDDSLGIAIDGARNAYVTGQTGSSNFPVTTGAFDRTANGSFDAFVTKLNAAGSALVYSTRLGGEDNELPEAVKVDGAGNAYVGGSTRSSGFPTTPGAFDTTHGGGAFDERFDLFQTKLNPAGSALIYSTFIGGSHNEFGSDFDIDGGGNAYIVGGSQSVDFPGSFALKLNPAGSALVYSRSVAGAGAIAAVGDGTAWVGGAAGPDGPTTPDAFDPFFNGGTVDAYVAKLDGAGSVVFASFLGGSESEAVADVALGSGDVYLTGHTYSPDFTTTPGAFDRTWAGDPLIFWGDAFVAKVDADATAPPVPSPEPAPAAPALVSPSAAATVVPPVTFDWSDVSGAVSYTIQVDEISAFGAPLILSASTSASTFTTSSLPDGNWFWRVRGVNSEGTRRRLVGGPDDHRSVDPAAASTAHAGHRDAGQPGGRRIGLAAVHVRLERRRQRGLVRDRGRRHVLLHVARVGRDDHAVVALDQLAPERDELLARAGVQLRRRGRALLGGPHGRRREHNRSAPGADADRSGQRRPLLSRPIDHVRLERRGGCGRLHDPDRRLAVVLRSTHRRRVRRELVVRHEHAADAAPVVARARERRRRVVVSAAT